MPRGNLETINPRALVLSHLRNLLDRSAMKFIQMTIFSMLVQSEVSWVFHDYEKTSYQYELVIWP